MQNSSRYPLVLFTGCAAPAPNFTPELKYFPERLTHFRAFPQEAANFLFPNKIELSNSQGAIEAHFFNFYDENGRSIFGISAVLNLPYEYEGEEMFADCCVFILLSQPLFYRFEAALVYFVRRVQNIADLAQAAEQFYSRVALQTYQLPAEIDYMLEENSAEKLLLDPVYQKGQTPYATRGLLLKKASPTCVCDLLEAALQERSIIFTGESLEYINQSIFDLLMLLYPFTWPFVLFSTLPARYLPVIHEPIPGIYGIQTRYLCECPVPQDMLILNTDDWAIYQANAFSKLGIEQIRTAIPRKALDILKQDFVQFSSKEQDAQQRLSYTYNFEGSDMGFEPDNIYYEIRKSDAPSIFKKKTVAKTPVSIENRKKFIKIPSEEEKAKNHVYRLLPASFTYESIARLIQTNARLFDLNQFIQVKKSINSPDAQPLQRIPRNRSKSRVNVVDGYFYTKPRLPEHIRQLIIGAITQNSTLVEKTSTEPANFIIPHPYALLLEEQLYEREQVIFGAVERGPREEQLDEVVHQMSKFDIQQAPRESVLKELQMENSPMSVLLKYNDKIQLPDTASPTSRAFVHIEKIRVAICAALLSIVAHYKRSLLLRHEHVSSEESGKAQEDNPQRITSFEIVNKQLDPLVDYFTLAEYKMFFSDIQNDVSYAKFPYTQVFDPLTFIAESPDDFAHFNEYFVNSQIFHAFLEARLCVDCIPAGYAFPAYDGGQFYAQNAVYQHIKRPENNSNTNSLQVTNYTTTTIKTSETSMFTEESQPDQPSSVLNVSTESKSVYDYQQPQYEDLCDFADMLLKYQVNAFEQAETNPHYEFRILKQSGGDTAKWQERMLHVDINQAQITLRWFDKKEEKGLMIVKQEEFAPFVERHADWPNEYVVCVYGIIRKKGENKNRVLSVCMMNYEDQRSLLYILRRMDSSHRLRLDESCENAVKHIKDARKYRRYALGNFYKELCKEGASDEFVTRIYQSLDERETRK